ncbi:MAG: hypothetical protein JXB40_05555 [Candidatus Omnitrophica bacterium]|nr:hypothetical protein [Candidatus Omnitrophota bacterium]
MAFNKSNIFLKTISLTVAVTFLWQQISWAGDLSENNLLNQTLDNLNSEQSSTFAPQYLQDQQAIHQSLIDQMQFIEDATVSQAAETPAVAADESADEEQGEPDIGLVGPKTAVSSQSDSGTPEGSALILEEAGTYTQTSSDEDNGAILSITTQTGDIIHYRGGLIDKVETKDSSGGKVTIERISGAELLDTDNNLANARVTYLDGTVQIVTNGKVSTITLPNKDAYTYDADERIDFITHPDGSITNYDYDNPDETVLEHAGQYSYYDINNILTKVVKDNGGTTINYDNGVIQSVTTGGATYTFRSAPGISSPGCTEITLDKVLDCDGYAILFDGTSTANVISIESPDHSKIAYFNTSGEVMRVVDGATTLTRNALEELSRKYESAKMALMSASIALSQAEGAFQSALSRLRTAQERTSQARNAVTEARNNLSQATAAYNNFDGPAYVYRGSIFNRRRVENPALTALRMNIYSAQNAMINAENAYHSAQNAENAARSAVSSAQPRVSSARYTRNHYAALEQTAADAFMPVKAVFDDFQSRAQSAVSALEAMGFFRITYDSTRNIKEILKPNGEIISYANGLPNGISGASGVASYVFTTSALGNITGLTIDRDGIRRIYDEYGTLGSLVLSDDTTVTYGDSGVEKVEDPVSSGTGTGSTIKNFVFDSEGNVAGCDVLEADGTLTTYINGKIDHKKALDGSLIKYIDQKIDTVENPDGKIYKYIYETDGSGNITSIRKELIQYKLADGTALRLTNGVIERVIFEDGRELTAPIFDSDGKLQSADFIINDYLRGVIAGGIFTKLVLSGETEIYYDDGLVKTIIGEDGTVSEYSYLFGDDGTIIGTIVNENGTILKYSSSGELQSLSAGGCVVTYEAGGIKLIYLEGPKVLIQDPAFYEDMKLRDGTITFADNFVITFQDGRQVSALTPANAAITYGQNGYIESIEQEGITERYEYAFDGEGKILSIQVTHNRCGEWTAESLIDYLKRVGYANQERISNFPPFNSFDYPPYQLSAAADFGPINAVDRRLDSAIPDPEIRYEINYSSLAETTDMSAWGGLYFGLENYREKLVNIKLRKDENTSDDVPVIVEFYANEDLVYSYGTIDLSDTWQEKTIFLPPNLATPNRIVFRIPVADGIPRQGVFYAADITCLQLKSLYDVIERKDDLVPNAVYIASYLNAPLSVPYAEYISNSTFFNPLDIEEFFGATPLFSVYDSSDRLTQIKRTNGSIVNFSDSKPDNMIEPDGSVVDYIFDGSAFKRASLFPESDLTTPEVVLEYDGNKIKKAIRGDVIYSYTYEPLPDGKEITVVKNEATYYIYRYKDGRLLSTTSNEGLVTEYGYQGNTIISSMVKYQDTVMETFSYDYGDDFTIVTDEKGVKRTYDKDNRLVYLETAEGLGYKYNYIVDGDGNNVLEVELYQSVGSDGIIIYHKNGNINSIQLRDGTIVMINDSDDESDLENMTINDGLVDTVIYKTGERATYLRDSFGRLTYIKVEKDDVTRWYNPEGELVKLQDSPGTYYLYGYTRTATGAIDKTKITKVTLDPVGGEIPPVKIYAYSAGYDDGWDAGILVDDRGESAFNTNWWWSKYNEQWSGRGYDVVVIDGETGEVKNKGLFDVYNKGYAEASRMAAFINSVATGDYVIMAIGDEGSVHMNNDAYLAIESIGSTMIRSVGDRDSWAIIGRKGAAPGTVIEGHSPKGSGPVLLPGYRAENYYYDKDGNYLTFSQFYNAPDSNWFSIRPTQVTDELEIITTDSANLAVGYIKNFNSQYADSGFIRLFDTMDAVYDEGQMQQIDSLVGHKNNKAVYYDPRYPGNWTTVDFARQMKDYFAARGYMVLNADELRQWMNSMGPDSVVIMAQDIAPSTIISKYTSDCAARTYLDNGGTYVWIHDMPFHYIGYADDSKYDLGEIGEKNVLGIVPAILPRIGNKYESVMEDSTIPEYIIPVDQQPLDNGMLTFDFSVNYRDIDWHKIKDSIGYELKEDTTVVLEYDAEGKLMAVAKADRTISFYEDGEVSLVSDIHGDAIVEYTYDSDGNITSLRMTQARRDLDYRINDARNRIEEERRIQLEEVAIQGQICIDQIKQWADSQRAPLYSQRSQYENQLRELEGRDFWWPWEKRQKSIAMDQLRGAINAINEAIRNVDKAEADEIAGLSDELRSVNNDINNSATEAFIGIVIERDKFLEDIKVEEQRAIIYEYYRDIMGRDPGDTEVSYWVDIIKGSPDRVLNIAQLKTYLYNSAEYIERNSKVGTIRGEIESLLSQYILKTPEEKAAFLASHFHGKLTLQETVSITADDITRIAAWLSGQNLHFGRSAANIIGNLLADKGTPYAYDDLIRDVILVDILTGTINKFTEAELLISAHALDKVASIYGLDLTPVKLSFEELQEAVGSAAPEKVVVLIGGNHYVIVTDIDTTNDEITYIETSKGPSGETVKTSVEEFKDVWQGGYALVQGEPLNESAKLTTYQAMKVRGACFFELILGLFYVVNVFLVPIIQGIAVAIVNIVSAIVVPMVYAAFNLLVEFVGGLVYGAGLLGKALFAGLEFVGTSLFKGFASFFALEVAGASQMSFTPLAIATSIGKTVVAVAVNYGINAGLDALGVSPMISRFVSAFTTGGIAGAFGNNFITGFFSLSDAFGALAIQGVNYLGVTLNLPQPVIDAFSIAGGSLVGGMFKVGTDIPGLLTSIGINLASELAYIGITKAGELLGVDPRISYLAGVGIRSTINAGLTHEFVPDVIWGSVQNGLLRGITSVALEWGAESLGLSPLIGSLTSAAIAGGLEALLMGQNPVQGIFDTYFRAGTGLLTLGGDGGNNPWLRAAYISQVLDFSQIVQERGIVNALETYAAGFLHQQTINEIWKQGGIAQLLTEPNQVEYTTDRKGRAVKRIYTMVINSENDKLLSNYIDLSPTYDMLMGFREGNVITHCEFVIGPDGRPQLKNGEREILNPDGSRRVEYVENFKLAKIEYYDSGGNKIGYSEPLMAGSSIMVGVDNNMASGRFVSLVTDYTVSTKDNQVTDLNFKRDCAFDAADVMTLLNLGVSEQDIAGFKEVVSFINGVVKCVVLPPDTAIFNINTEEGRVWRESIEARGQAFWTGLYDLVSSYIPGDPLPTFTSDAAHTIATMDLNLKFPIESESVYQGAMDLFSLFIGNSVGIADEIGSIPFAWSRWEYSTDQSAKLYASRFNQGYNFVLGSGANSDGWSIEDACQIYNNLNITKRIGVGFSADATSLKKSWTIANSVKAEINMMVSPQLLSPDDVYESMIAGGISADNLFVIETVGDFAEPWLGSFADNKNADGSLKWHYIKLLSGGNLSLDIVRNHGAAMRGILSSVQYDEIMVDGKIEVNKTLAEVLSDIAGHNGGE